MSATPESAPSTSGSGKKRLNLLGPVRRGAEWAWNAAKENAVTGSKGVIGGISDATVMNVWHTLGDTIKKPVLSAVNTVTQPLVRTALAAKELVTLHPGKAVAQLAVGADRTIENAVNVAQGAVETVANSIKRVSRGVARAVAGVVGENILGERYGDLTKDVSLKIGAESMGTGGPELEPTFA